MSRAWYWFLCQATNTVQAVLLPVIPHYGQPRTYALLLHWHSNGRQWTPYYQSCTGCPKRIEFLAWGDGNQAPEKMAEATFTPCVSQAKLFCNASKKSRKRSGNRAVKLFVEVPDKLPCPFLQSEIGSSGMKLLSADESLLYYVQRQKATACSATDSISRVWYTP